MSTSSASSATLCIRCGAKPPKWEDVYCPRCSVIVSRTIVWRRRGIVAFAWLFASLIEGMLGLGIGTVTIFSVHMAGGQVPRGGVIASLLLLAMMALLVMGSHSVIMRPVVRHAWLWGTVDGAELLVHWLLLYFFVRQFAFFYGVLALSSLLAGTLTACLQALILRRQATRSFRWVISSMLAWVGAGLVSTSVEMLLHDPVLSIVYGVASGRLTFGMLSSPLFGWIVVGEEHALAELRGQSPPPGPGAYGRRGP